MTFRMHDFKDLVKGNHHKRCIITKLLTLLGVSIQIRKWCIAIVPFYFNNTIMKLKMLFISKDFIRFDHMLRQTVCYEEINHQVK